MEKPELIKAIDAQLETSSEPFECVAPTALLSDAALYLMETTAEETLQPPFHYRGVRIVQSMYRIPAPGYVMRPFNVGQA